MYSGNGSTSAIIDCKIGDIFIATVIHDNGAASFTGGVYKGKCIKPSGYGNAILCIAESEQITISADWSSLSNNSGNLYINKLILK